MIIIKWNLISDDKLFFKRTLILSKEGLNRVPPWEESQVGSHRWVHSWLLLCAGALTLRGNLRECDRQCLQ